MASRSIEAGHSDGSERSTTESSSRSERLDPKNELRNEIENDLSLPQEPRPPIIGVDNVSTVPGRDVHSLSQSVTSYNDRLIRELRKDLSWYSILAAAMFGFVWHCSSILAVLIAVVCYGIHEHLERSEKEERMRRCQEYLDKDDEGKKQFLTRINLTHLEEKLNKKGRIEGSFGWFNDLVERFWPFLNPLIQKEVDQHGLSLKGPGIEALGSKIKFNRLTLGDRAPSVSHIKLIQGSRNDEIILNCQLLYYGNCLMSFSRRALKVYEMKIGLKDIYFQADARITLRPVLPKPPFLGGLVVTLVEPPLIDFEGFNLGSLADNRVIKNLIITVISGMVVEPNKLSVSLMKDHAMKRSTAFPVPLGLCYFEVIEIHDLAPSSAYLSNNQIFCIVKVGETFFQTDVNKSEWSDDGLENDRKRRRRSKKRNVQVNYKQSAPFHDFIDTFSIQVIDKDTSSSSRDGSLGNIRFQISSILGPDTNGTRKWLPLNRSMTGRVHFRLTCLPLTCNPMDAKNSMNRIKQLTHISDDFPIGFLSVYLHEIRSFPGKQIDEDERPFVMIRFAGETFTSRSVTKKLSRVPYKLDHSCHFILNEQRLSRLMHVIILDSYKVSPSHANKPDFMPIKDQILASRSFKITRIFDEKTMSFERVVNMYQNDEPIVQVLMFVGITITKFDPIIYNNLKDESPERNSLLPKQI